jgi:hypothetical protein
MNYVWYKWIDIRFEIYWKFSRKHKKGRKKHDKQKIIGNKFTLKIFLGI